jgi:predicted phage terminase large subunit-like protein
MAKQIKEILKTINANDLYAAKCRRSFYFFVQYFWDTIIAEKPVWNWHIKYLCDELQAVGEKVAKRLPKDFDYFIINIPPGSSKSTIISEMYPLWCWVIDPTQRFICGSYASTPAEDMAEKCYNIYTSDKFKRVFPELVKRTTGGKTNFKNGLRGERYTTSTGSAITGIHAHQIILDDPMNPEIASSDKLRATANIWLSETISNRKVDARITITIIVMQRLHMLDSTGYILSKGLKVKHICIPAEISEDIRPIELKQYYIDGLFDPLRKSREILEASKKEYGSYGYAGQMMQRPSPADGGLIEKKWFMIVARQFAPTPTVINYQADTAYTDSKKNDPSGVLSYFKHKDDIYIINYVNVYKTFPQFCEWLPQHVKNYGYNDNSKIYIEPKANGKAIVQQLRVTSNLNIIEDKAPTLSKVGRVNATSPKMEAGRIFLIEGHWNDEFLNNLAAFPNAAHDEAVDCLTAIIERELIKTVNFGNYQTYVVC